MTLSTETGALCVRCRTWQTWADEPELTQTDDGHYSLRGRCAACGARMVRFVRNPEGEPVVPDPFGLGHTTKLSYVGKLALRRAAALCQQQQKTILERIVGQHREDYVKERLDELEAEGEITPVEHKKRLAVLATSPVEWHLLRQMTDRPKRKAGQESGGWLRWLAALFE